MIDYGLKDKVAIITGANNLWGIGAATALALAREGAKVVLVYKKIPRGFDEKKTDKNGVDRYFASNAGDTQAVERKLKEINADYLVIESDISNEENVKEIYEKRSKCIVKLTFWLIMPQMATWTALTQSSQLRKA